MKRSRWRPALGLAAFTLAAFGGRAWRQPEGFDHWQHRKLFTSCQICHAGAVSPAQPLWPAPSGCETCHDGRVQKVIRWSAPAPRPGNLQFTHAAHAEAFVKKAGRDTALACLSCHGEKGAAWMRVARAVPGQCLDCHGINVAHYDAPDTACATCHVPLARAAGLSRERIATFPEPESHRAGDFRGKGHGRLAQPVSAGGRTFPVAPSCATCHAREFCVQCHVDAPEVHLIQALEPDPRSTAIAAQLEAPASHEAARFLSTHGRQSRREGATCATCHTRESCATCHRGAVAVASGLHAAGPGRAPGARIAREAGTWHPSGFRERHGPVAGSNAAACAACHARAECLDCHRPNPGSGESYHAAGFLARHPAAAYGRQNDCSECHNPAAFCTGCHVRSGFRSNNGILEGRYHDAAGAFLLNHGRAARFNLESCVTCHSEADCLACHSAQTRRFNPHGPGFDAERLKRKNPQTCAACHGRAIP